MWKWICGLAAISVVVVSVAYRQHYAREKYEAKRQEACIAISVSPEEKHVCYKEAQARKDYAPWWNVLVAWPEGIGVWAVILTLGAIAWQSDETRKSAKAAERNISLQTESLRPRLSISSFTNNVFDEARSGKYVIVNMKIANSGGMPAYAVIPETWIEFIEGLPPHTFTSAAKYNLADPINVHTGKPQGFMIPLAGKLTAAQSMKMANAQGAICFRIRMKYVAFGEEVHTDEAFMVRPNDMEVIAKYTSAT